MRRELAGGSIYIGKGGYGLHPIRSDTIGKTGVVLAKVAKEKHFEFRTVRGTVYVTYLSQLMHKTKGQQIIIALKLEAPLKSWLRNP